MSRINRSMSECQFKKKSLPDSVLRQQKGECYNMGGLTSCRHFGHSNPFCYLLTYLLTYCLRWFWVRPTAGVTASPRYVTALTTADGRTGDGDATRAISGACEEDG